MGLARCPLADALVQEHATGPGRTNAGHCCARHSRHVSVAPRCVQPAHRGKSPLLASSSVLTAPCTERHCKNVAVSPPVYVITAPDLPPQCSSCSKPRTSQHMRSPLHRRVPPASVCSCIATGSSGSCTQIIAAPRARQEAMSTELNKVTQK